MAKVNPDQLAGELRAALGAAYQGLAVVDDSPILFGLDALPPLLRAKAEDLLTRHVPRTPKSDEAYRAEFHAAGTTAERKQVIRDILLGLLPRDLI